jgi:hypothetical protein
VTNRPTPDLCRNSQTADLAIGECISKPSQILKDIAASAIDNRPASFSELSAIALMPGGLPESNRDFLAGPNFRFATSIGQNPVNLG